MPHIGEKIRIYFPTIREAEVITMTNAHGSSGEMSTTRTMNKPTEKYLDTKWGKQVALHGGDVDINTPLMSMVLDEENIILDSNQNIEIKANEVLNIGRSEFKYIEENNVEQVKIEETQSISIETEELCTVSVTSFGTVIELDEDNLMMPLDKVIMEGSIKNGFADMGSAEQNAGEEVKLIAEEEPKSDVADEVEEESKFKKKSWKRIGIGVLKAVGAIALGVVAVAVLPIGATAVGIASGVLAVASVGYAVGLAFEGGQDIGYGLRGDEESKALNPIEELLGETAYNVLEKTVQIGWFIVAIAQKAVLTTVLFGVGFTGTALWDAANMIFNWQEFMQSLE